MRKTGSPASHVPLQRAGADGERLNVYAVVVIQHDLGLGLPTGPPAYTTVETYDYQYLIT